MLSTNTCLARKTPLMPRLAKWSEYPEGDITYGKIHLKARMNRLPDDGLDRVKKELPTGGEVPKEDWYLDFGDFIVPGRGGFIRTYLGPDEMGKVRGYELRCWRNSKNNPAKLKKCWRNRSSLLNPATALLGEEE